ncbi:MAG: hypothetical protein ACRDYV_08675 [Acidimicrobiia bacterium]
MENGTEARTADEIGELLDEIGMEFALHTHHPLTHLELGDAAPDAIKQRAACSAW